MDITENTLHMMDESARNLRNGKVGEPVSVEELMDLANNFLDDQDE